MSPILVWSLFVVAVGLLCLVRPKAARIFLGIFFLIMALGVNGTVAATDPHLFVELGRNSLVPFYRPLFDHVVGAAPLFWGIVTALYEISAGLLVLHRGRHVKTGLLMMVVFCVGTAPFMWMTVPNLGMALTAGYLLTRNYDYSLIQRKRVAA